MSNQTKPVLVIPVYKGGKYFEQMLDTLKLAEDLFSNVVVSFNGDDSGLDQGIFQKSTISNFHNILTLRTTTPLSAIRHMHFWVGRLKDNFHRDTPIFVLCHDDLLLVDNVRGFLNDHSDFDGVCVMGDWEIVYDEKPETLKIGTTFPPGVTQVSALELLNWQNSSASSKKKFTNLSGMIVALRVLSSVSAIYHYSPDSYGARIEYCLATSRHNKEIIRALPPLVRIREHSNQQGKTVPKLSGIADELRYRLWLLFNLKGEAFRAHCLKGPVNIFRTHSLLIKYVVLKFRSLFRFSPLTD
ncbi:MAG: hypothetical protein LW645_01830 [Verrucomicrobiaceae bacterium]|jgi:hypothetical protein|nr:hypothetical protein [Verrucomicrobiaceae bacterium]